MEVFEYCSNCNIQKVSAIFYSYHMSILEK